MEFVSPEGLRQDGRRPHELRNLKCDIGTIAKADGSASFEMGNTKVGPQTAVNTILMTVNAHMPM